MVIQVENLTYRYRTFQKNEGIYGAFKDFFRRNHTYKKALNKVSFAVKKGEIIGLLGPNGAGKTTLVKLMTGLIQPLSGTVSILGHNPHRKNRNFLKQIGVVLGQKSQLIWDLPPIDTFSSLRVIYGVSKSEYSKNLEYFSHLLNLREHLYTPTRNLSLGERMKCEIMASLLHSPNILFLDEPTIGVDILSQKAIRDFLTHVAQDFGVTIFFTSHHLADIEKLSDKLFILKKGKLCYQGSVQQLVDSCSQEIQIKFSTNKKNETIVCNKNQLSKTIKNIILKYEITDLALKKGSLEEAIYAIFEQD